LGEASADCGEKSDTFVWIMERSRKGGKGEWSQKVYQGGAGKWGGTRGCGLMNGWGKENAKGGWLKLILARLGGANKRKKLQGTEMGRKKTGGVKKGLWC